MYDARDDIRCIVPIYDRPYLATSPRKLWQRWSVTAGYHFRHGFYKPFVRKEEAKASPSFMNYRRYIWIPTLAPFLVNCLLHIHWWSLVIKGEIKNLYWNLIFAYPLLSFFFEDVIIGRLLFGRVSSSCHIRQRCWQCAMQ